MAKLIGDAAMTAAQRQQRRRDKLRTLRRAPSPSLDLALDAEVIAARIMMSMPPDKADRIVAALNQRLVHRRMGRSTSAARTSLEAVPRRDRQAQVWQPLRARDRPLLPRRYLVLA